MTKAQFTEIEKLLTEIRLNTAVSALYQASMLEVVCRNREYKKSIAEQSEALFNAIRGEGTVEQMETLLDTAKEERTNEQGE